MPVEKPSAAPARPPACTGFPVGLNRYSHSMVAGGFELTS
jgi:hypothetical protein